MARGPAARTPAVSPVVSRHVNIYNCRITHQDGVQFVGLVRERMGVEVYNVFIAMRADMRNNQATLADLVRHAKVSFKDDRYCVLIFNSLLPLGFRMPVPRPAGNGKPEEG